MPKDQAKERLEFDPATIVFVYVGTLIHLKGVDVLIEAFSRLHDPEDRAHLLIVGPDGKVDGRLRELQRQASQSCKAARIRFCGRIPWDDLGHIYRAADCFVLPTRKDMWPKVLIEASVFGLPLITTSRCGAAGFLVRDQENGYVVGHDDACALRDAMARMMNDKARRKLGEASQRIASEFTGSRAEIGGYKRAFSMLLASS